jgi:hypothetical protein
LGIEDVDTKEYGATEVDSAKEVIDPAPNKKPAPEDGDAGAVVCAAPNENNVEAVATGPKGTGVIVLLVLAVSNETDDGLLYLLVDVGQGVEPVDVPPTPNENLAADKGVLVGSGGVVALLAADAYVSVLFPKANVPPTIPSSTFALVDVLKEKFVASAAVDVVTDEVVAVLNENPVFAFPPTLVVSSSNARAVVATTTNGIILSSNFLF